MKSERESLSVPFAGVNAPQGDVFNWESSDHQARVTMEASLAREFGQTAIRGFLKIPRRGVEVGGLLFGRVRRQAGQSVFEITGAEDVACEHRFGPSYVLDAPDRQHLAQLLSRRNHGGSPPVVGFYRSFTSREPLIDANDQDLLTTFFPDRPFVWLLLQPSAADTCSATFEIASLQGAVPEPPPAPIGYVPPPVPPEVEEDEVPAGERRVSVLVASVLVAIVAITAFFFWMQERRESAARVARTPVGTAPPAIAAPPAPTQQQVTPAAAPPPPEVATTPPSVRRRFEPRISPGIRRRITTPILVPVVVHLDASGRVTSASSDVREHGLHRYLADEAVKAAHRWRFAPARSADGQPVASTTTISFEFTRAL